MDDGERMLPWQVEGLRRVERWRHGHVSHHALREVTLGRMPDGRWLVEVSDVRVPSLAYRSKDRARQRVAELTTSGGWVEVPAEQDAAGQPTGDGWRRTGGTWVRQPSGQAAEQGQAE